MASTTPLPFGIVSAHRGETGLAEALDGAIGPATSVAVFNGQLELVTSNTLYRDIFGTPDELVQPGTHIAEILRHHYEAGTYMAWRGRGPDVVDVWLRSHLERMAHPGYYATVYELRDSRRVNASYAALADGGWISCARDFTAYPAA